MNSLTLLLAFLLHKGSQHSNDLEKAVSCSISVIHDSNKIKDTRSTRQKRKDEGRCIECGFTFYGEGYEEGYAQCESCRAIKNKKYKEKARKQREETERLRRESSEH